MTKPIPTYLKLVTVAEPLARESDDLRTLLDCCRAFERTTGWKLEYASGKPAARDANLVWSAPVDPGVGTSLGHIRVVAASAAGASPPAPAVALPEAKQMAGALAAVWDELQRTRKALWQREAELAAGVPVSARPDEAQHLAARLEAVLAAGVESLNCQAAALYLLDAGTSELKLRASCGLPHARLLDAARPLRGAAADLEALLGHAVVLDDPAMFDFWRVPESCAAAVCVPVSSPTTPLGTLWLFSDERREFSDAQTNLLEVIAGRLAADLEREMLLGEVNALRIARVPAQAAQETLRAALPPRPDLAGWEIAGWSADGAPGSGWLDWFSISADHFALVAGTSSPDAAGALGRAAARLAVRTAADIHLSPAQLMNRLNAAFWCGNQAAAAVGLNFAALDTYHGVLQTVQCGAVGLLATHKGSTRVMEPCGVTLGAVERIPARQRQFKLAAGDLAVVWCGQQADAMQPPAAERVAAEIARNPLLPAPQLAAKIGSALGDQQPSRAIIVVRRC